MSPESHLMLDKSLIVCPCGSDLSVRFTLRMLVKLEEIDYWSSVVSKQTHSLIALLGLSCMHLDSKKDA